MYERDQLFIGGAWVPAAEGGRIDVISPSTEEVIGHVPRAIECRRRPCGRGGARRVRQRAVAAHVTRGTRGRARAHGRVRHRAGARARRPEHRRSRGTDHVRVRARDGPARDLQLLHQPHPHVPVPRGPSGRDGTRARGARADRCGRRGRAVQRPADVGGREDRPGARRGLPDRVQAGVGDPARRVRARRRGRGRGHPARRAQHRAGRCRRRCRDRRAPRRRPRAVHGQHHGRAQDRGVVGRVDETADARARRQGRRDPARRRARSRSRCATPCRCRSSTAARRASR